ncbi:hypothetical protein AUEXF2481DRAFT_38066 [Aureobasidium subglaciale EXF-2481]|uniref:Uncharacterized protein n=1 Tax=Aureobasidium subglaciale (strain EXF-2481) TaxID=1043005 RepID=A0A074YIB0_AURSE|nr:uncharacterized protein AUEXF2481DRAFT_38066 [Aureobasidium subglaciale EXF-2481]KEQ97548.1 hypothetical protein AUEXF2481DRAFT_38066 [Aureobasidium subglaciale EXF-2481]
MRMIHPISTITPNFPPTTPSTANKPGPYKKPHLHLSQTRKYCTQHHNHTPQTP